MPTRDLVSAVWTRTYGQSDFDLLELQGVLRRNAARRYGITLAMGCPFSDEVQSHFGALRQALEDLTPGLIRWVLPAACHLTVYGLKRSRPRPFSPAQINGLVSSVGSLVRAFLVGTGCLRVPLAGPVVSRQGALLLSAAASPALDSLRLALCRSPGVDPLNVSWNHITFGQFVRPFGSQQDYLGAMEAIRGLGDRPGWTLVADHLRLVCYRNRLLEEIGHAETIGL